jgi:hypothetical protein
MPTTGNGTTPTKAFLEAPVPDVLLEQGRRPKVDSTREYIAGGGGGFPLVGQQVLAKGVDDLSRDLGLNVYEAMLHDSTVASAVAILITGVLSGEFQLLPAIRAEDHEIVEPGSDREQQIQLAQEIRDFCQRNIDRLDQPIKMLCHELLYAMVLGCKLAEKVFEQGEGEDADKLVLKTVRTKRNAAWEFVVEPTGDIVAIRALTFDLGQRDLPPEKFLIVSWMPRDGDPRGRSILRPAYNGWNLKINLFKHYNKYLEKFGCPTIIGVTAPDARDEAELNENGVPTGRLITPTEAMAQMLARLDGGSYAAVPFGASIHPIQPNNNGNAFLQAFQLFKTEILEAILITSRSVMPARHSSKADSETAQDTVGQILLYGREMLEDCLHDQLFWQLVSINYGKDTADLYTPHVSLGAVEHQDIATVAVAYNAIGYAIDPMQLPAIDAKLGLPVRKPTATTIEEVDGNPVGFSANGTHDPGGVPDRVLAQAMRVLDAADRRLAMENGGDQDAAFSETDPDGDDTEEDTADFALTDDDPSVPAAAIGDLLADHPDPVSELAGVFADLADAAWQTEAESAWRSLRTDQNIARHAACAIPRAACESITAVQRGERQDLIATMVLVLLGLHDAADDDTAGFNCGTGAGGFKEGNKDEVIASSLSVIGEVEERLGLPTEAMDLSSGTVTDAMVARALRLIGRIDGIKDSGY